MGCNQSTSARDTNFKGRQKHTLSAHIDKKKINKKDMKKIEDLLKTGKIKNLKANNFKKFGSERKLYNFNIDNISDY